MDFPVARDSERMVQYYDWVLLSVGFRSLPYGPSVSLVAKLPVVRAAGRVECSASELYELLVSKEGVQLLNPSADLRDYDKPFLGPFPLRPEDEDGSSEKSSTDSQKPRFVQLERTVMKVRTNSNLGLGCVEVGTGVAVCHVWDHRSLLERFVGWAAISHDALNVPHLVP